MTEKPTAYAVVLPEREKFERRIVTVYRQLAAARSFRTRHAPRRVYEIYPLYEGKEPIQ